MATASRQSRSVRRRVFLFRRLRKLLGLTQAQIARFSSVALRQYRRLENERQLPKLFQLLNHIAHAFGLSFECNLMRNPDSEGEADNARRVTTLAAAYRSPYLHIALMNGDRTVSLRRQRIGSRKQAFAVIEPILIDLGCSLLVVEPKLLPDRRRGRFLGTVTTITLGEAKRIVFSDGSKPTHRQLFEDLIHHFPELCSAVKVLATGRIAMTEPWRVNALVPAALGIAAHWRDGDPHSI